jgi:DNA-binding transcriptional ArsR family regulator
VIVDDAHRTDVNLAPLLSLALRRSDLTVVLGSRPAGVDGVRGTCSTVGVEGGQIVVLPRMRRLAHPDVERLAVAALKETSERGLRLAEATEDLPLLTVLGGRMLLRGDFGARSAGGAAAFRAAVLERFAAEQRGLISDRVPIEQAQRLLSIIAALNPVDSGNPALIGEIANELGISPSQVRRWLGDIEDAGLLLTLMDDRLSSAVHRMPAAGAGILVG